MSDVFISYARSTEKQAQEVADALRALGHNVWRDDELPAHRAYTEVLEERLRAAKAVVVIWSAEAVKSHWVRAEADVAREAGTLVQLRVDGATPPLPFNQIQCADMAGWTGNLDAPGWRKVAASVAELVGAAAASADSPFTSSSAPGPKPAITGNLLSQATSFVGRETEVAELVALAREQRLVTLTGVGGVGKTRLALRVADALASEFPDGAWLVELAPVSDPAAVQNAVATALGITAQGARSVTEAITEGLSGRRLLLVLDNCEHVLDAAADLVEGLLARTTGVTVIATSREGLGVGSEHLWPVPSLGVGDGSSSAAVRLFVDRARAVKPGFVLGEGAEAEAVVAICQRLDGIALAIELAAARMMSMTPGELLTRLTDRFRLLSGSRRGLERHQTLRQAVQWSYDLLSGDERMVLNRCSIFAGGFDLAAASQVCGGEDSDEYAILDLLDSLVRKSLVTAEQVANSTRYGLLEIIRQFAEEKLAASGENDDLRDRHAQYFADQVVARSELVYGPRPRDAYDWADIECANLRVGFRWAADKADLDLAADIAAHAAGLCWERRNYEPFGWVLEILPAAAEANIRRLPRLYVSAVLSTSIGNREPVPAYCDKALSLKDDPSYDPFDPAWGVVLPAIVLFQFGRDPEESLAICRELAAGPPGSARVAGLNAIANILSAIDRTAEARPIAEEAVAAARALGNPVSLVNAELAFGRAHMETDPGPARNALRAALSRAQEHGLERFEITILREIAALEAVSGDVLSSLALFDSIIDSCQRRADDHNARGTVLCVAVLFDRKWRPDAAATLLFGGAPGRWPVGLGPAIGNLREVLGDKRFATCVAAGAAMKFGDAVRYARKQIALAQQELTAESRAPGAG